MPSCVMVKAMSGEMPEMVVRQPISEAAFSDVNQIVRHRGVDYADATDIENELLGLRLFNSRKNRSHDVFRATSIDNAHDWKQQDACPRLQLLGLTSFAMPQASLGVFSLPCVILQGQLLVGLFFR